MAGINLFLYLCLTIYIRYTYSSTISTNNHVNTVAVMDETLEIDETESNNTRDKSKCNLKAPNILICQRIPKCVPPNVTTVIVNFHYKPFKDEFVDPSWGKVRILHITGGTFDLSHGHELKGLENLRELTLNGTGLTKYHKYSFVGLNNTRNMTLARMSGLDGASFQRAFTLDGVLPAIRYFELRPDRTYNPPFVYWNRKSIEAIVKKSVIYLHLIDLSFEIASMDFVYLTLSMQFHVLNVTGSLIVIYGFPNSYELMFKFTKPLVLACDTTSTRLVFVPWQSETAHLPINTTTNISAHQILPYFLAVETWLANYIYPVRTELKDDYDLSLQNVFWKRFELAGNNIAVFNSCITLPSNNTLVHFDISRNDMEYLSDKVLSSTRNMLFLFLSHNRLFRMQRHPEFQHLFVNVEHLRVLDMSYNKISYIPWTMFRSNVNIETLDLSKNHLQTISFNISHMLKLELLNLRANLIKFLQDRELNRVQLYINERKNHNGSVDVEINFQDNPLLCSCDTTRFVSWLAEFKTENDAAYKPISCNYEGDVITVNKKTAWKCSFLCRRTLVITVSIATCVTVTVVIVCLVFLVRHIRSRNRTTDIYSRIIDGLRDGKFLCFVAVSGKEEHIVNKLLVEQMTKVFKVRTRLLQDLVCTGIRFRPGFSIYEESYRLVKLSHVFVAIVSKAFIESQYCRTELEEACKQNKPSILILLGNVETQDMSPYMQELFRRNSRAWIKQTEDGAYYVVPGVLDICASVWELAANAFRDKYRAPVQRRLSKC